MIPEQNIPSESEQNEAWEYVCKRDLIRPNTNIIKVLKYTILFICIDLVCTFVASLILQNFNVILLFLGFTIFGLVIFSKKIIIGLVHLYQHYAPERIRRKCIFKPTCSEYMILALKKYGLIRGLYKGIYRVFFKCSGFYYSIDYP
jgi:putative component of membrane protein insertase Oxa1/YidC/SpoIIIJ protein YidD